MARINGTAGDDNELGNAGNNQIFGFNGNDHIYGVQGNDHLDGGNGNDYLQGGLGRDWISGGAGNDYLDGDDASQEGPGDHDEMYGGDGNDTLFGDAGSDYLSGGVGNDWVVDWAGNNRLFGGPGDDYVAGSGYDQPGVVHGILWGGDGNDRIEDYGSAVAARENGGAGADTFVANMLTNNGNAERINIDDFKPADGDKVEAHTIDARGVDNSAYLFDGFDTNHDGVIKGDGSDLFSANTAAGLELHNWEDTLVFKGGVDHIDRADWIL